MTSGNLAIENKRLVLYVQNEDLGNVAVIVIGAMCVGSVNVCLPNQPHVCSDNSTFLNGQTFDAGDDFGYFAFGGSTIAVVFPERSVNFNQDLLFSSSFPTEQYVHVRTPVADVNVGYY